MLVDSQLSPAAPLLSRREKDDNYYDVIVVLNTRWRVIRCKDGIQWVIQKASPSEWRSVSYPRNRDGLLDRVRSLCGPCSDAAMAKLVALPDWIHQTAGVVS